jgi:hypothetical protein
LWIHCYSSGAIQQIIGVIENHLPMLTVVPYHLKTVADIIGPKDILSNPVVGKAFHGRDFGKYGPHICGWVYAYVQ